MSLLKTTEKLLKRSLCDEADWSSLEAGCKPMKSARIEGEQPLDFTTSSVKKLKAAAARLVAQQQAEVIEKTAGVSSQSSLTDLQNKVKVETHSQDIMNGINRTISHEGQVKDEDGMWRPW